MSPVLSISLVFIIPVIITLVMRYLDKKNVRPQNFFSEEAKALVGVVEEKMVEVKDNTIDLEIALKKASQISKVLENEMARITPKIESYKDYEAGILQYQAQVESLEDAYIEILNKVDTILKERHNIEKTYKRISDVKTKMLSLEDNVKTIQDKIVSAYNEKFTEFEKELYVRFDMLTSNIAKRDERYGMLVEEEREKMNAIAEDFKRQTEIKERMLEEHLLVLAEKASKENVVNIDNMFEKGRNELISKYEEFAKEMSDKASEIEVKYETINRSKEDFKSEIEDLKTVIHERLSAITEESIYSFQEEIAKTKDVILNSILDDIEIITVERDAKLGAIEQKMDSINITFENVQNKADDLKSMYEQNSENIKMELEDLKDGVTNEVEEFIDDIKSSFENDEDGIITVYKRRSEMIGQIYEELSTVNDDIKEKAKIALDDIESEVVNIKSNIIEEKVLEWTTMLQNYVLSVKVEIENRKLDAIEYIDTQKEQFVGLGESFFESIEKNIFEKISALRSLIDGAIERYQDEIKDVERLRGESKEEMLLEFENLGERIKEDHTFLMNTLNIAFNEKIEAIKENSDKIKEEMDIAKENFRQMCSQSEENIQKGYGEAYSNIIKYSDLYDDKMKEAINYLEKEKMNTENHAKEVFENIEHGIMDKIKSVMEDMGIDASVSAKLLDLETRLDEMNIENIRINEELSYYFETEKDRIFEEIETLKSSVSSSLDRSDEINRFISDSENTFNMAVLDFEAKVEHLSNVFEAEKSRVEKSIEDIKRNYEESTAIEKIASIESSFHTFGENISKENERMLRAFEEEKANILSEIENIKIDFRDSLLNIEIDTDGIKKDLIEYFDFTNSDFKKSIEEKIENFLSSNDLERVRMFCQEDTAEAILSFGKKIKPEFEKYFESVISRVSENENKIDSLECGKINEIENKIENAKEEIEKTFKNAKDEIEALSGDIRTLLKSSEYFTLEINDLKEEREKLFAKEHEKGINLQKEIISVNEKIDLIEEKSREYINSKETSLHERIIGIENMLLEYNDTYEKNIEETKTSIVNINENIHDINTKIEERHESVIDMIEKDKEALDGVFETLRYDIDSIKESYKYIDETLRNADERLIASENMYSDINEKLSELGKTFEYESRENKEQAHYLLQRVEKDISELENKLLNETHIAKIDNLENSFITLSESFEDKIEILEDKYLKDRESIKEEISMLKKDYESQVESSYEMKGSIEETKEQFKEFAKDKEMLHGAVEKLEDMYNVVLEKISSLSDINNEIEEKRLFEQKNTNISIEKLEDMYMAIAGRLETISEMYDDIEKRRLSLEENSNLKIDSVYETFDAKIKSITSLYEELKSGVLKVNEDTKTELENMYNNFSEKIVSILNTCEEIKTHFTGENNNVKEKLENLYDNFNLQISDVRTLYDEIEKRRLNLEENYSSKIENIYGELGGRINSISELYENINSDMKKTDEKTNIELQKMYASLFEKISNLSSSYENIQTNFSIENRDVKEKLEHIYESFSSQIAGVTGLYDDIEKRRLLLEEDFNIKLGDITKDINEKIDDILSIYKKTEEEHVKSNETIDVINKEYESILGKLSNIALRHEKLEEKSLAEKDNISFEIEKLKNSIEIIKDNTSSYGIKEECERLKEKTENILYEIENKYVGNEKFDDFVKKSESLVSDIENKLIASSENLPIYIESAEKRIKQMENSIEDLEMRKFSIFEDETKSNISEIIEEINIIKNEYISINKAQKDIALDMESISKMRSEMGELRDTKLEKKLIEIETKIENLEAESKEYVSAKKEALLSRIANFENKILDMMAEIKIDREKEKSIIENMFESIESSISIHSKEIETSKTSINNINEKTDTISKTIEDMRKEFYSIVSVMDKINKNYDDAALNIENTITKRIDEISEKTKLIEEKIYSVKENSISEFEEMVTAIKDDICLFDIRLDAISEAVGNGSAINGIIDTIKLDSSFITKRIEDMESYFTGSIKKANDNIYMLQESLENERGNIKNSVQDIKLEVRDLILEGERDRNDIKENITRDVRDMNIKLMSSIEAKISEFNDMFIDNETIKNICENVFGSEIIAVNEKMKTLIEKNVFDISRKIEKLEKTIDNIQDEKILTLSSRLSDAQTESKMLANEVKNEIHSSMIEIKGILKTQEIMALDIEKLSEEKESLIALHGKDSENEVKLINERIEKVIEETRIYVDSKTNDMYSKIENIFEEKITKDENIQSDILEEQKRIQKQFAALEEKIKIETENMHAVSENKAKEISLEIEKYIEEELSSIRSDFEAIIETIKENENAITEQANHIDTITQDISYDVEEKYKAFENILERDRKNYVNDMNKLLEEVRFTHRKSESITSEEEIKNIQEKLSRFEELFSSTVQSLENKSYGLEAKSNELENKTYELETKSNELENKTYELETKSNELENKTYELETKSNELENVLEKEKSKIAELSDTYKQSEEDYLKSKETLNAIKEEYENIASKISNIALRHEKLEEKSLSEKDSISFEIEKLKNNIESIKLERSSYGIKEEYERLKEKTENILYEIEDKYITNEIFDAFVQNSKNIVSDIEMKLEMTEGNIPKYIENAEKRIEQMKDAIENLEINKFSVFEDETKSKILDIAEEISIVKNEYISLSKVQKNIASDIEDILKIRSEIGNLHDTKLEKKIVEIENKIERVASDGKEYVNSKKEDLLSRIEVFENKILNMMTEIKIDREKEKSIIESIFENIENTLAIHSKDIESSIINISGIQGKTDSISKTVDDMRKEFHSIVNIIDKINKNYDEASFNIENVITKRIDEIAKTTKSLEEKVSSIKEKSVLDLEKIISTIKDDMSLFDIRLDAINEAVENGSAINGMIEDIKLDSSSVIKRIEDMEKYVDDAVEKTNKETYSIKEEIENQKENLKNSIQDIKLEVRDLIAESESERDDIKTDVRENIKEMNVKLMSSIDEKLSEFSERFTENEAIQSICENVFGSEIIAVNEKIKTLIEKSAFELSKKIERLEKTMDNIQDEKILTLSSRLSDVQTESKMLANEVRNEIHSAMIEIKGILKTQEKMAFDIEKLAEEKESLIALHGKDSESEIKLINERIEKVIEETRIYVDSKTKDIYSKIENIENIFEEKMSRAETIQSDILEEQKRIQKQFNALEEKIKIETENINAKSEKRASEVSSQIEKSIEEELSAMRGDFNAIVEAIKENDNAITDQANHIDTVVKEITYNAEERYREFENILEHERKRYGNEINKLLEEVKSIHSESENLASEEEIKNIQEKLSRFEELFSSTVQSLENKSYELENLFEEEKSKIADEIEGIKTELYDNVSKIGDTIEDVRNDGIVSIDEIKTSAEEHVRNLISKNSILERIKNIEDTVPSLDEIKISTENYIKNYISESSVFDRVKNIENSLSVLIDVPKEITLIKENMEEYIKTVVNSMETIGRVEDIEKHINLVNSFAKEIESVKENIALQIKNINEKTKKIDGIENAAREIESISKDIDTMKENMTSYIRNVLEDSVLRKRVDRLEENVNAMDDIDIANVKESVLLEMKEGNDVFIKNINKRLSDFELAYKDTDKLKILYDGSLEKEVERIKNEASNAMHRAINMLSEKMHEAENSIDKIRKEKIKDLSDSIVSAKTDVNNFVNKVRTDIDEVKNAVKNIEGKSGVLTEEIEKIKTVQKEMIERIKKDSLALEEKIKSIDGLFISRIDEEIKNIKPAMEKTVLELIGRNKDFLDNLDDAREAIAELEKRLAGNLESTFNAIENKIETNLKSIEKRFELHEEDMINKFKIQIKLDGASVYENMSKSMTALKNEYMAKLKSVEEDAVKMKDVYSKAVESAKKEMEDALTLKDEFMFSIKDNEKYITDLESNFKRIQNDLVPSVEKIEETLHKRVNEVHERIDETTKRLSQRENEFKDKLISITKEFDKVKENEEERFNTLFDSMKNTEANIISNVNERVETFFGEKKSQFDALRTHCDSLISSLDNMKTSLTEAVNMKLQDSNAVIDERTSMIVSAAEAKYKDHSDKVALHLEETIARIIRDAKTHVDNARLLMEKEGREKYQDLEKEAYNMKELIEGLSNDMAKENKEYDERLDKLADMFNEREHILLERFKDETDKLQKDVRKINDDLVSLISLKEADMETAYKGIESSYEMLDGKIKDYIDDIDKIKKSQNLTESIRANIEELSSMMLETLKDKEEFTKTMEGFNEIKNMHSEIIEYASEIANEKEILRDTENYINMIHDMHNDVKDNLQKIGNEQKSVAKVEEGVQYVIEIATEIEQKLSDLRNRDENLSHTLARISSAETETADVLKRIVDIKSSLIDVEENRGRILEKLEKVEKDSAILTKNDKKVQMLIDKLDQFDIMIEELSEQRSQMINIKNACDKQSDQVEENLKKADEYIQILTTLLSDADKYIFNEDADKNEIAEKVRKVKKSGGSISSKTDKDVYTASDAKKTKLIIDLYKSGWEYDQIVTNTSFTREEIESIIEKWKEKEGGV